MNWQWSQVKIVERILNTAGNDEESVCRQLALSPDEYEVYCENLESRGLAVIDDEAPGVLRLTDSGRALLRLINKINGLTAPKKQVHALEQVVELEPWSPACAESETVEWRGRIFENYMQEQMEVEKLEARIAAGDDKEVTDELEQRYRRLGEMQSMLDKMGYVVRELRQQDNVERNNDNNCRILDNAKKSDIRVLADRMYKAYVLEQADLTMLEVQLRGIDDAEANQELAQRLQRLETLKNLLGVLQRMIKNHPR